MIKAVVTDIDGVILGAIPGVNFPLPSLLTQDTIRDLTTTGIPVGVCTMKAYFAIRNTLIIPLNLTGYHITDGGGVIASGATHTLTTIDSIPHAIAQLVINEFKQNDIYTEYYTTQEYFVSHATNHTEQKILAGRAENLGVSPSAIDSIGDNPIIKIYALPESAAKIELVNSIVSRYSVHTTLHWGKNPSGYPELAGIITPPQATKEKGLMRLAEKLSISCKNILALGDSTNDWTFMKHCGYVATPANGTEELKTHVRNHPHGFVSKDSVNENGFTDIVRHFTSLELFAF